MTALMAVTLVAPATAAADEPDRTSLPGLIDTYQSAYDSPGIAVVTADADAQHLEFAGHDGNGNPVGADTRFRIASMSKAFTAFALLRLADTGRLELDEPVTTYLPDFAVDDPRSGQITARHLLTHRSGLDTTRMEVGLPSAASAGEIVRRLSDQRLAADPGTATRYSNAGYGVAARLVEVLTGRPFTKALQQLVIDPLGMTSTVVTTSCVADPSTLSPGAVTVMGFSVVVPELPQSCEGSGGIISTATDMARWMRFRFGDGVADDGTRLLSPDAARAVYDVPPKPGEFGLGWQNTSDTDIPRAGHGGTLTTFTSSMEYSSDAQLGVVVLTNNVGDPSWLTRAVIADHENRPIAAATNPLNTVNGILLALTVATIAISAALAAHATRWGRRHAGQRIRTTVGIGVPAAIAVCGALLPAAAGTLTGIGLSAMSYPVLLWLLPVLPLWALTLLIGGAVVTLCRIGALRAVTPAPVAPAPVTPASVDLSSEEPR